MGFWHFFMCFFGIMEKILVGQGVWGCGRRMRGKGPGIKILPFSQKIVSKFLIFKFILLAYTGNRIMKDHLSRNLTAYACL